MGSLLLDDVADYLSSGGLGTRGTTIFTGLLPALSTDRAILISETGGVAPIHTMHASPGNSAIVERPRIQVLCRGVTEGYQGARQDAENAFHLLNGLRNRTINGTSYLWCEAVQQPFQLPPDQSLRPLVAFNVDILKTPSTSTST